MAGKPSQFNDWPESLPVQYSPFRAVIDRVVDGDTVYVFVSLGMDQYTYESIRIYNLNAPELFTADLLEREKGRAARTYLESIAPPGTRCVIRTDRDRTTFGRYVASVLLEDGRDVASEMVAAGHGEWAEY